MALVKVQSSPITVYLSASAANSHSRMVNAGMPAGSINSGYRSIESQKRIFLSRYERRSATHSQPGGPYGDVKWYDSNGDGKPERYVRMRGLPVAVPGTSKHNQGLAMDVSVGTAKHNWLLKNGSRYGWHRPLPNTDKVHWEYVSANDADLREQSAARVKMRQCQGVLKVKQTGVRNAQTIQAWDNTMWNALKKRYWYVKRVRNLQTILGVASTGHPNTETGRAWDELARKAR